jgi:threonylcarbamoyladenosine tRNA methylthiotransferase MtaB
MPNQVPENIKSERSHQLIQIAENLSKEFRSYYVGKDVQILTEEFIEVDGQKWLVGYTPEYVKCAVKETLPNQVISLHIKGFLNNIILYC